VVLSDVDRTVLEGRCPGLYRVVRGADAGSDRAAGRAG